RTLRATQPRLMDCSIRPRVASHPERLGSRKTAALQIAVPWMLVKASRVSDPPVALFRQASHPAISVRMILFQFACLQRLPSPRRLRWVCQSLALASLRPERSLSVGAQDVSEKNRGPRRVKPKAPRCKAIPRDALRHWCA